jgi:hypothetical protein
MEMKVIAGKQEGNSPKEVARSGTADSLPCFNDKVSVMLAL